VDPFECDSQISFLQREREAFGIPQILERNLRPKPKLGEFSGEKGTCFKSSSLIIGIHTHTHTHIKELCASEPVLSWLWENKVPLLLLKQIHGLKLYKYLGLSGLCTKA
jgi:hypothetical protein